MNNFAALRQNKSWTYIYLLQAILFTVGYSLLTLYKVLLGHCTRACSDDVARRWARKLIQTARANINCVGLEKIQYSANKRYILMSNHTSLYDIPLIFAALPGSIRMLAKKELFDIPMWGKVLRYMEFISIDRKQRERAISDLQLARKKMESGIILWVAPEGTRSSGKQLLPLKKGPFILAIETQAIIIPIGIRGASAILPKHSHHLTLNVTVDVQIGDAIDSGNYTLAERDKLIERVYKELTNLAGYHER